MSEKSYATVESLTGGNLSALFTSVDGSSEYFRGGIIAYQEGVKKYIGVNCVEEYDNKKLALDLAKVCPIHADIVISTTGYIDRAFAFCIYLTRTQKYMTKRLEISEEHLQLSRPQRQQALSRLVMAELKNFVQDKRLDKY